MAEPIDITVVIVCLNEAANIERCLNSVLNQDLDAPYGVSVIDGGSSDGTIEIIKNFQKKHPGLRLLNNPEQVISPARNMGWQTAQTPFIAYIDADCKAPSNWLRTLLAGFKHLEAKGVNPACVGGGNYPPGQAGDFYKAIDIFTSSPFGNRGTLQTHMPEDITQINHAPTLNTLYRRKAVEQAGGFDEKRFPLVGEDEDLNTRLSDMGLGIYFIPGAPVAHYQKNDIRSWAKNMVTYGFGRVKLMKRHKRLFSLKNFMPLLLPVVMGLPLLSVLSFNTGIFLGSLCPLAFYLLFFLFHSFTLTRKAKRPNLFKTVFALFPVTHFFYAAGMAKAYWESVKEVFST